MGTLVPHSNGPLYSNTVIGTLTVDGWYIEEGPGQAAAPPSPLLAVPIVTAHPSTSSVLGPILFVLYSAEIGRIVARHGLMFHQYADDCQIYVATSVFFSYACHLP